MTKAIKCVLAPSSYGYGEAREHVYRFDLGAAERIATNAYADGANRFQRGRLTTLYRTARGRWVWHVESQWRGERDTFVAATDANGQPYDEARFDAQDVECFLAAYGHPEDVARWREDIGRPLPLA